MGVNKPEKISPDEIADVIVAVTSGRLSITAAAKAYGVSRETIRRWTNGAVTPNTLKAQPCGTVAAYRRHLRNKEVPCLKCSKANARATVDYKARHGRAVKGFCPGCGNETLYLTDDGIVRCRLRKCRDPEATTRWISTTAPQGASAFTLMYACPSCGQRTLTAAPVGDVMCSTSWCPAPHTAHLALLRMRLTYTEQPEQPEQQSEEGNQDDG